MNGYGIQWELNYVSKLRQWDDMIAFHIIRIGD